MHIHRTVKNKILKLVARKVYKRYQTLIGLWMDHLKLRLSSETVFPPEIQQNLLDQVLLSSLGFPPGHQEIPVIAVHTAQGQVYVFESFFTDQGRPCLSFLFCSKMFRCILVCYWSRKTFRFLSNVLLHLVLYPLRFPCFSSCEGMLSLLRCAHTPTNSCFATVSLIRWNF